MQDEARVVLVRVLIEMLDAAGVERRRAPFDAMHAIALGQQEFGEISAVPAGDAGDQSRFQSPISSCSKAARRANAHAAAVRVNRSIALHPVQQTPRKLPAILRRRFHPFARDVEPRRPSRRAAARHVRGRRAGRARRGLERTARRRGAAPDPA